MPVIMSEYTIKKSTEHIVYEIWMFFETLSKLKNGTTDDFQRNVLLESFAIHSRNLFDFFYPKKNLRKDDMIVSHFIQKKMYFQKNKTPKNELLSKIKKAD